MGMVGSLINLEENMRVKNINGTADNTCRCDSWLNHWEKFSGQSIPKICPETNCPEVPQIGAHVQKDSNTDRNWYIVPLCQAHNNKKGESLYITDDVRLVSGNVSETCAKSKIKWI